MRRLLALAAAACVGTAALLVAPAASAEPIGGPLLTGNDVIVNPGPTADPLPEVPVTAWVLADLESGAILAAKAPHVQRPPASVLKSLTLLTLTQRLDPDLVYTTTYDDVAVEGSRCRFASSSRGRGRSPCRWPPRPDRPDCLPPRRRRTSSYRRGPDRGAGSA